MKIDYWSMLASSLKDLGFSERRDKETDRSTKWFESEEKSSHTLPVYLRFMYKSKLKVLSTSIGWSDASTHSFVTRMLREHWTAGYEWFEQTTLLKSPSILVFNLSEKLGYRYGGMPAGDSLEAYQQALTQLDNFVVSENVQAMDANRLLALYLADSPPFAWTHCNAALRLAHIAAMLLERQDRLVVFDSCVASRLVQIEADMYTLGSAKDWAEALRSHLI
jgi:hypothetical protein